jgi:hypothetical protein
LEVLLKPPWLMLHRSKNVKYKSFFVLKSL